MTEEEFCSKHGITRLNRTARPEMINGRPYIPFRTVVQLDITEYGITSLKEMSERDKTALELMHREHYENYMREKYPGIKSAWERYQLLLKIAND